LIFDSIVAVINIFVLLIIGAILTHRKWITEQNRALLSKLVIALAVPCTIFNNLLSAINHDTIKTLGSMLVAPACTIATMYFGAWFLSRHVFRMRQNRQRTYAAMAACPNTIFFGMPVALALFGDQGVPAAMFYFICQSTFFWSFGNAGIQADAQGKGEFSLVTMIKKVFTININVTILVFVLVIIGIRVPSLVTNMTKIIGALSTPLSLFFTGNALYETYTRYGIKGLKIGRDVIVVLIARFLISPLLAFGFCTLFGITGMTRIIFVVMSGMPNMVQTVILTGLYNGDRDYAALCFFWTSVFSLFVIPLYVIILG